uniref:phosphoserine transaminase n=1 Tax=Acrobeloides nanus TaxID=290746 RepID=A0A914DB75_9BILA
MSHRSADFTNLLNTTKKLLSDLMSIPQNYDVMFFHGGGTGQFAAIPLNLRALSKNVENPTADYAVTGSWSHKAMDEGAKYIHTHKVFDIKKPFVTVPDPSTWNTNPEAAYLYYCANETIHGVEFQEPPTSLPGVPLIADISSNILSRYFDVSKHGMFFAGAQKNVGISGVTIVGVQKDLIGHQQPHTPAVLSFKEIHKDNSLYNTPCSYGIYITKLVLEWIRDLGGVDELEKRNKTKASLIYDLIDSSEGFYRNPVDKKYRSRMNIPIRIKEGDEALEAKFIKESISRGMISLKGHRSVGGIRASLYNAITIDETQTLADFMKEFMEEHKN